MKHRWGRAEPFSAGDVYRDWFDHVYRPGQEGAAGYAPCLVRVAAPLRRNLRWLARRARQAGPGADLVMDPVELARLDRVLADAPGAPDVPDAPGAPGGVDDGSSGGASGGAPEFFVHIHRGVPAGRYDSRFTPLPHGAGHQDLPRPARPARTPAPIVAVIDDSIGYLNARFCRSAAGRLRTRLHRVWLQTELGFREGRAFAGQEIGAAEIDALLARGAALDETAEYAARNMALQGRGISPVWHGLTETAGSDRAVTHGTHVLDIAGGADPAAPGPTGDQPLLAVQLPPQAVEDTSGSRLVPHVLRALRWIFDQAADLAEAGCHRPLIVNLSIGVLAGAKDGTGLLDRQMAAEIRRREAATGAATRVVLAFGNDNLTRQLAHLPLAAAPRPLTLRIQSEDYTPSFVELRPDRPEDLRLGVAGALSDPLPLGRIGAGRMVSLDGPNGAVARIYGVPPAALDGGGQTAAWYLLALAPTATFEAGKPLAPSGGWTIRLASAGAPQECRVEVQRDDRPMGFAALARQSYLDDPEIWQWRPPHRAPYAPPAQGPVTRLGTQSAYVPARLPEQVWSVGAALSDTGFAAPYSATGAPWGAGGPGSSAIGDSSWTLRGVMAAGTLSGTTAVISGTSVAAPQIARQLAAFHRGRPDAGPWRDAAASRAAEEAWLKATDWAFVPVNEIDRLGAVCVSDEQGLRPRLDTGFA